MLSTTVHDLLAAFARLAAAPKFESSAWVCAAGSSSRPRWSSKRRGERAAKNFIGPDATEPHSCVSSLLTKDTDPMRESERSGLLSKPRILKRAIKNLWTNINFSSFASRPIYIS